MSVLSLWRVEIYRAADCAVSRHVFKRLRDSQQDFLLHFSACFSFEIHWMELENCFSSRPITDLFFRVGRAAGRAMLCRLAFQ